ncbi:MAG: pilin [Candidatus Magasanikbacteria bacterium]
MKKIFFSIIALGLFIAIPAFAVADLGVGGLKQTAEQYAGYAPATGTSAAELVGSIIQVLLSLVGSIFLILVFYAGYLWMTARGEESQVEKAKKIVMQATIGLILVVGAYSITSFVVPRIVEKTTGQSTGTSTEAPQDIVQCCIMTDDTGNDPVITKNVVNLENECLSGNILQSSCKGKGGDIEYSCEVQTVTREQCK